MDRHFLGHLFRRHDHFRYDLPFVIVQIVDAPDMLFGYDQQMNRRMGIDVLEHHDLVILEQKMSRRLTAHDLAKGTFHAEPAPMLSFR